MSRTEEMARLLVKLFADRETPASAWRLYEAEAETVLKLVAAQTVERWGEIQADAARWRWFKANADYERHGDLLWWEVADRGVGCAQGEDVSAYLDALADADMRELADEAARR